MKRNFLTLLFVLLSFHFAQAQLSQLSLQKLLQIVEQQEFNFQDRDLVFGYNTTQSCLYVRGDVAILENYCFPVRNYPARSFTLFSKKFGIVHFYEEITPDATIRYIEQSQFIENVEDLFLDDFDQLSIGLINDYLSHLYEQNNPACWSTNYSYYTKDKDTNCVYIDPSFYTDWFIETQSAVNNPDQWDLLFERIQFQLKK